VSTRVLAAKMPVDLHACRWCGKHNCLMRETHAALLSSGETYWRQSPAERLACPSCGVSVLDAAGCAAPMAVAA